MNFRNLTITTAQIEQLRNECNSASPLEGACQMLIGASSLDEDPWSSIGNRNPDLRLTVHRIEPIPSRNVRRRETNVSWDMDCYVDLLGKARRNNLNPGICHSHPNSNASFSHQDDENECHLRDVLQRRNRNQNQFLISVLLLGNGQIEARVWRPTGVPEKISVRVLGATLTESGPNSNHVDRTSVSTYLQRQALCIGPQAVKQLQTIRVAVIGCGGTGSAVSVLLARAGVGRIFLVDSDVVAKSNLNRLHGSTRRDVINKSPKVSVLKNHIIAMGLGTEVSACQGRLVDATVARQLRSCDVIFGCTDDHYGRLLLNRLAYFYFVPVIDTGLSVDPIRKDGTTNISGRVTVLRPGVACLLCRGIVNANLAREQSLRYKQPDEYARQVKEGYITGSELPTPIIGTFTTETAAAAVNEFLAGICGLRGERGWASERRIRYDLDRVRPTGGESRRGCSICDSEEYWGLGDVQPFLDLGGV